MVRNKISWWLSGVLLSGVWINIAVAASEDVALEPGSISISPAAPLAGSNARLYVIVKNVGGADTHAVVRARDGSRAIGADQPVTLVQGAQTKIFFDWNNVAYGDHILSVKIIPWKAELDNPANNSLAQPLFIDRDSDNDTLPDKTDPDDDNDGVCDAAPATDTCHLNPNGQADQFPLNKSEWLDADRDGLGDNADLDDDGDNLDDTKELALGTDPTRPDTDGDGVNDGLDAFPLDATETLDTDADGVGNRQDPDDDNDGVCDTTEQISGCTLNPNGQADAFPLNKNEWLDSDGDGTGNNLDQDDDHDGLVDSAEKDLGTDPLDPDSDHDGTRDGDDKYPLDNHRAADTDNDGQDNTVDVDDDNDGVCDTPPAVEQVCHLNPDGRGDAFPLDRAEWEDTDEDGIGNNRDPDDDNDGYCDLPPAVKDICQLNKDESGDAFPLDRQEWHDTDHDGLGDNSDPNSNNLGPVIKVDLPPEIIVGLDYELSASGSFDPDGTIMKTVWAIDDQTLFGPEVHYTFNTVGEHELVLTVGDNKGEDRTARYTIHVERDWRRVGTWLLVVLLLGLATWLNWRTPLFKHRSLADYWQILQKKLPVIKRR